MPSMDLYGPIYYCDRVTMNKYWYLTIHRPAVKWAMWLTCWSICISLSLAYTLSASLCCQ